MKIGFPTVVAADVWEALVASLTTAGSIGKLIADNLDKQLTTFNDLAQSDILSDATPFDGANVDASVSSRATQAQILSDATPFDGANVDAAISSRMGSTLPFVEVSDALLAAGSNLVINRTGITTIFTDETTEADSDIEFYSDASSGWILAGSVVSLEAERPTCFVAQANKVRLANAAGSGGDYLVVNSIG